MSVPSTPEAPSHTPEVDQLFLALAALYESIRGSMSFTSGFCGSCCAFQRPLSAAHHSG